MPEKKKAAVSTPDTPLLQQDWDEARRVRAHEFLPAPCTLNVNAAKEAEDSHRQTPPVAKSDQGAGSRSDASASAQKGPTSAEEKDAFRANAPETPNAPVQPKQADRAGAGDRRSDNEVVRQEGLNAPREEAKKHEVRG